MSNRRDPYLRGELTCDFNFFKKGEVFILQGGPVVYFAKSPTKWAQPPQIISYSHLQITPATLSDLIQIKLLALINDFKTQSKDNT